jgi:hypothetical protein
MWEGMSLPQCPIRAYWMCTDKFSPWLFWHNNTSEKNRCLAANEVSFLWWSGQAKLYSYLWQLSSYRVWAVVLCLPKSASGIPATSETDQRSPEGVWLGVKHVKYYLEC